MITPEPSFCIVQLQEIFIPPPDIPRQFQDNYFIYFIFFGLLRLDNII